jgi:anhydro-N-acetylmuramic acid kinase
MDAERTLYVGTISGTSMDGLDLALVNLGASRPRIIAGATEAFEPTLRDLLATVAAGERDDLDHVAAADHRLGEFIARSVLAFVGRAGYTAGDIAAIGSHGQTVRHVPQGALRYTWQVGDPNLIAEHTGITTVADFRRRDMAAGGEGAPLVPLFHAELFRDPDHAVVVVNIGGIGNITVLPADTDLPIRGFDTGPGNGLMDAWIQRHRGVPYDSDGAWGASGRQDDALLSRLLDDPYFRREPPKSTGKEYFNLEWLNARLAEAEPGDPADVQATLATLTARSLADSIVRWGPARGRVVVCGGGRLNMRLMQLIADSLPDHQVKTSDALGIGGDWLEAAAFAWLAAQTLHGRPGNAAAVTGARGPRVLGGIYPG